MKKLLLVVDFVSVFLVVFACTFLTSYDLATNDITFNARQALGVALVTCLVLVTLKRRLCAWKNLPFAFLFFAYGVIIPLVYLCVPMDVVGGIRFARWYPIIGGYLVLFLLALEGFLQKRSNNAFGKILFSTLYIFGFSVFLVECGYIFIYGKTITDSAMLAIYGTNIYEAFEYVETFIGFKTIGIVLLFLLSFGYIIYHTRRWDIYPLIHARWKIEALTFLLFAYLLLDGFVHFPLLSMYLEVHDYLKEQAKFAEHYEERFDAFHLKGNKTLADKEKGTVILVIGESATRNMMKAYQKDYAFSNTPHLSSWQSDDDFIVFNNVYACYSHTNIVLMRALTDKSQYNDHPFYDSMTVLDVAKKAGYATHWFTNQGLYDQYSSIVTMIAKRADEVKDTGASRQQYDGELLQFLQGIDKTKNNFIVLHLMGSHTRYHYRYPKERAVFGEDTLEETYANSIFYTDALLNEIISYAQANLNLKLLFYFSDHGENLQTGHNAEFRKYDTVRIPCFMYVAPRYQELYPEKVALLRSRKDTFFSNDMFYNTFSGMLDAQSDRYDEKEDLSSKNYAFSRENVKVFLGELLAKDDPFLDQ